MSAKDRLGFFTPFPSLLSGTELALWPDSLTSKDVFSQVGCGVYLIKKRKRKNNNNKQTKKPKETFNPSTWVAKVGVVCVYAYESEASLISKETSK